MRSERLNIPDVLLLENDVYQDERGLFTETWHQDDYKSCGIHDAFIQDNVSVTVASGFRGLHLQNPRPQGKLVRVLSGSVFDVVVDVRLESPTFGQHVSIVLEGWSQSMLLMRDMHMSRQIGIVSRQLWVPPGFAHGFFVLSGPAVIEYKCTDFYVPDGKLTVRYDDPALKIDWPVGIGWALMSQDDREAPYLDELTERLPRWSKW